MGRDPSLLAKLIFPELPKPVLKLQSEVHSDLENHLSRNVVQVGRLILPLPGCGHRRFDQERMTGHELEIRDSTVLGKYGLQTN
jgi:hypothetical protein